MIVIKSGIRALRLIPRINNTFARKKSKKGEDDDDEGVEGGQVAENVIKEDVKIDEKQVVKSAALYDYYVKSRSKPMLTLDNYQIKFVYVIERSSIFLPYHPKRFDYYRNKYQFLKKTGYYPEIPKELQVETGDYLFTEYERVNPENQITHRKVVSKTEVYEYAEHTRYWRYTDQNVKDPHSVQAYSSDNVYFITRDKQGNWEFPSRTLTEKDNHKEIFKVMNNELFEGGPSPLVYFNQHKPIYARKTEDSTMSRGVGFYEYFFRGLSINGIPKFPTENYADYAWVPKPLLSQYFSDEYFKSTIKLAIHIC